MPQDEKKRAFQFTIIVVGEGKDEADAWDDAKPMFEQYADQNQYTEAKELK
jgi:hypothetical protein